MAIPIFPSLPGLTWPQGRAPNWSTILQKSQSGKKSAVMLWTFPEYQYTLDFEFLRTAIAYAEFQEMLGFVNQAAGQGNVFYFTDPDDCQVTDQPNGVGDGVTADFQLYRTLGGFAEPVQSPNVITSVTVGGAPAAYTLGPKGIVTFAAAPALGAPIHWSGSYYWLCRLDNDQNKFSKITGGRYELKQLSFTTEKL